MRRGRKQVDPRRLLPEQLRRGAALSSAARIEDATPAAAEDKCHTRPRLRTAGRDPKTQENSKYSTQIVVCFNYMYYFWASDPSKYDVNRVAVS